MKVRIKNQPTIIGSSHKFNIHALNEVLVGFEDDYDSYYISDLDVFIEALNEWKDMGQAFKDKDIIIDNYNTYFFEPKTEEDRKRGYTL